MSIETKLRNPSHYLLIYFHLISSSVISPYSLHSSYTRSLAIPRVQQVYTHFCTYCPPCLECSSSVICVAHTLSSFRSSLSTTSCVLSKLSFTFTAFWLHNPPYSNLILRSLSKNHLL